MRLSGIRAVWLVAVGAVACSAEPGGASSNQPPPTNPPALSAGGGAGAGTEKIPQPAGWDAEIAPPPALDLNPDPHVLEVELDAREADVELSPGVATRLWTYNGGIPGPLLRARVGDRLIVHFTNHLSEPTTIHWHGIHVPASMDGSEAVQDPVEPGGSFTYDFVLTNSGTFWYHPHIDSSTQVGYGLYGPIIVDDPTDPIDLDEVVLVFSDMGLTNAGQLQPGNYLDWFGDYFGRAGAVMLINGKVRPRLKAARGVPQRWRVINAARARTLRMRVPDMLLVRVGGDSGLIERAESLVHLELAASERADVILVPPLVGSDGEVTVLLEDADRFGTGNPQPPLPLMSLEIVGGDVAVPLELPVPLRLFPERDLSNALPRRIEFSEVTLNGVTHLAINGHVYGGARYSEDGPIEPTPGHDHGPTHTAYVGDTEIWEVVNLTDHTHPFHLHGFSFEVLERAGVAWPVRELKDSVNLLAQSSVKFAVTYDDRPGHWMFHCHILDHVNIGMMAMLSVERRP